MTEAAWPTRFGFGRVLVAAGGGDNMMGAIGSGNVRPGVCTLSLGTSGTVYAYSAKPFVDPEGEIAAFCDSTGGWLPLLCTMNVTNTTEIVEVALRARQRRARAAGPQGRPGRGRPALPAVRRRRARARPALLERRLLRARPADLRRRAHRPVGHGGHGPQPGLRLRPDEGAGTASRPRSGPRAAGPRAASGSRSSPTSSGRPS
ncbi:MAG: hypothetical protein M0C28_03255 [Candidatus Moduliflexus flocculans]|nr:hypothetical protein [Candidatus Moduliflexus flocculans]